MRENRSNNNGPMQFEVHGMSLSDSMRALVDDHIRKLQSHHGVLMSGRIVIRAPDAHHMMGEPYAVSIHFTLPDHRQVNVGRVSNNRDPRYADLAFAIDDAFRRADRQLLRQVEKLHGEGKRHETSPTGRIVRVDSAKNCGFLASEDNREIYFHAHSVLGGEFEKLAIGDRVAFHEEMGRQGPQASTVRLLSRGHRA